MRSSGCSVQVELAEDAVAVMRRAVSLALCWGHAQVTTLHVASAMLSDAGGLLRAACRGSRESSYRLPALELCFSVALDSLAVPAMFQFHGDRAGYPAPALSNALAAAFKRVRGGSARHVATRQLVHLKQLVISILDDPGVSRVMSEAGFSSAEVQANVKKLEAISSSTEGPQAKADLVLDYMLAGGSSTKRCVVVLGESAAAAEEVVKAVVDKVSKGELRRQHERLRNAQVVPLSAASFQCMPREEVEASARDICAFVRKCCAAGRAVVLVLEDLGYAAEAWTAARARCSLDLYCPVDHAVAELSSLVRGKEMFWLLAFGAYASYHRTCRLGQPSLETVLELHQIIVPDGSLAFNHGGDSSDMTHYDDDRRHHGPMAESYDHQLLLANPNSGYKNYMSKSNPLDGASTVRRRPKFTELTAENLKILCSALETRIPRHRDIASSIASAVLQRRSGVTRRTRPASATTWFIFQGRDNDGKMAMARELARLVFGSYAEFTCITVTPGHSADSSTTGHGSLKRQRSPAANDDEHGGCMQMFHEAIRENPHRVVLINGVEHDSKLEAAIMNAMASGTARGCYGGLVSLEDCILVCSEAAVFESRSPARASSPRPVKQRIMSDVVVNGKVKEDYGRAEKVMPHYFSLELNASAIEVQGEEGSCSHNAVEILTAVDGVFCFN